jgi:hypothetical protein
VWVRFAAGTTSVGYGESGSRGLDHDFSRGRPNRRRLILVVAHDFATVLWNSASQVTRTVAERCKSERGTRRKLSFWENVQYLL